MIQLARFASGGFVLHKVTLPTSGLVWSVWFDANGKLIDAEGSKTINGRRVYAPLRDRMVKIRQQLQMVGNRYHNQEQ
jgi:hypothetical protein